MPLVTDDRRLPKPAGFARAWENLKPYLAATAIVGIASAVAPVLQRLPHANNSLLFLTGVLITAVRYGVWPSVYASLLSFVVYNLLFTPPFYTFDVGEEGDVATLVFFLVMASITGNLAARMREASHKQELALHHIAALQDFTRSAAAAASCADVLKALTWHLAGHFGADCIAEVPMGDDSEAAVATGHATTDGAVSADTMRQRMLTGQWSRWPIRMNRGADGYVAADVTQPGPDAEQYAGAIIDQAAVALDRIMLVAELENAKLATEREQLRTSLLSSVSHDLRTPLASIVGAASSLVEYEQTLNSANRSALLNSVLDETHRLDRYIQNLLDMTRLGHGPLVLDRDWEDTRDLVSAAVRRLRLTDDVRVKTRIDEDAQFIYVHGDLIEQVLVNLLANAVRYTPAGNPVVVAARMDGGDVLVDVADCGPGIPAADLERVFDLFYRVHERDRKNGTGLGLSICRGIARAHGGDVTAHTRPDGPGAVLRLRLPRVLPASGGFSS